MRPYYLLVIQRRFLNEAKKCFPEAITCIVENTTDIPLRFRRIYDLEDFLETGGGVSDIIENVENHYLIYPIFSGWKDNRVLTSTENKPIVMADEIY